MDTENRQHERYSEIGRVSVSELCSLPGILIDISVAGCKIRLPFIISVDMDKEYEVFITLSRVPEEAPLHLLCKPRWVQDYEESTEIGFMNIYSPDNNRLKEFIEHIKDLDTDKLDNLL